MSVITPAMRRWVIGKLRKGDQARIAELAGTKAGYVKHVIHRRPDAKSLLALTIWVKAYRYLKMREELQQA